MKITKFLLLLATLLLITACGSKTPFKLQKPLDKAALVYIYATVQISADDSSSETVYNIRINNKPVMQRINEGEFMVFNLKAQAMNISATKKQLVEKVLKLDLKEGQTYYLKIKALENGTFEFKKVDSSIALNEIKKTGLAGSVEDADNVITEYINPKETSSVQVKAAVIPVVAPIATPQKATPPPAQNISKTDEIMKAYEMKEKGIVSEEEFKALKINILNK